MQARLLLSLLFLIAGHAQSQAQAQAKAPVDTRSLLREIADYDQMARWPSPAYTEKQASSYDRKSISPNQPGWFANADASQYIRTEQTHGRTENVMLDADGPGAIVRFWLTTFKRHGNLRIYLDNHDSPIVTIPAYDLLKSNLNAGPALLAPHSSYEPTEKGGSTLYLPIPYAKHCKITWEDKDTTKEPRYYQINYRTYAKGTSVKTFSLDQLAQLKPLIDSVNHCLLFPDSTATGKTTQGTGQLNLPTGPRAIKLLDIDPGTAIDSLVIAINFDGKRTVYCPLADFAGGGKPIKSFYRTVENNGHSYIRWTMPYRQSAKITIINKSAQPKSVKITATTQPWHWDATTMYFHASWKKAKDIPIKKTEQDNPIEWPFANINARGVFLGDTYNVYNHMHSWYGEGDQNLWVDNDTFPSEHGTGTEDYYNTSWAPVVLYQTPFANAPRADNPDSYGNNTFTRTRNLDRVPFKNHFLYNLEMLGWQNGAIDASVVVYWYGF